MSRATTTQRSATTQRAATAGGERLTVVVVILLLGVAALLWRALDLHVLDSEFLQDQADARHLRDVPIPAHRGMITDRHGEPLAISTPVASVWAHPGKLMTARDRWPQLATALEMDLERLVAIVTTRQEREFVYLRRHLDPDQARQVVALELPGVALQHEYRRYYPAAEVAAHLIGFTNIDDVGIEGLELAYDSELRGSPGVKRVLRDRPGRIIADVASVKEPRPGRDLTLSLDRRVQYLAYRELKAAVTRNGAEGGSAVLLDVASGEVLAMVNQPAFNPNSRNDRSGGSFRNRAVTDLFEPGSTVKPFTIAAALTSGRYQPNSRIDTSPGWYSMSGYTIRDHRDYGTIDLGTVLQKSSNVGVSRIAHQLPAELLWQRFYDFGFGRIADSGFPGEESGRMKDFHDWYPVEQATLSYGYGLSTTLLQLARAYAVLAADGERRPIHFLRHDQRGSGEPVLSAEVATAVREMLVKVTTSGGTGTKAQVHGYRIAGKTGTVRQLVDGGYTGEAYTSLFVGMAPATRPRLVMAVRIDNPQAGEYYGGSVAAPIFARVMDGALRLLDIKPDDLPPSQLAHVGEGQG